MPAELAGLVDAVVIDNVVRMRPAVGDPPPLLLSGPPHDAAVASGEQNAIGNPGFESGKLSPWFACSGASNVPGGKVAHTKPHSGKYDAFAGNLTASTSEVDGLSGICQDITVPSKATFSYWVRPVSNDSNKTDVGQFVALYDQSTGKLLKTLYGVDANSSKWIAEKVSFGAYAGKKFLLFFGVVGSPADEGKYVGLYVDDVSLEGEATPTPKPTEKPTTKPSTKPTSSPTAGPTGNPITGPSTYNGFWGPGALVAPFAYPLEAGYTGAGVTVGVVMASPVQSSDIDAYKKYFGVPSDGGKVKNIDVDGGTTFNAANGASMEATLDVETIAGLAPGATINVYVIPELADNYAVDAYNTALSDSAVKVVNSSFSGCEADDPAYNQSTDDIALMGAAQGVTFAASSGDQGTECFSGGTFVAGVGAPASDPHVVGVGGTESYPGIASTQVWDDAYLGVPDGGAGGGGLSTEWAPPSYQKGISGASTTHRSVPDIALPAVGDAIYVGGAWTAVDGTSWASPLYAAMQAEIDEACGAQYGLAELYTVYKAHPSDFIDVTSGNNEYGGTPGYNAVKGFDLASGMGSPLGTGISYETCKKPAK
jgi:kumamolisin